MARKGNHSVRSKFRVASASEKNLDLGVGRPLEFLLWASLASLVATLSLQRILSFDYWWALRTGKLILETGAIPSIDPYSFTSLGSRWIDIHWLHQIGMYATYLVGGHEFS